MNTLVNFELAKLLKEKGFDNPCSGCYDEKGICGFTIMSIRQYYTNSKQDTWNVAAPTIAELVMWLYEKHGIWIRVHPVEYEYANPSVLLEELEWCYIISNIKSGNITWEKEGRGNSPTEAYEAAITYTLTKLI